MFECYRLARSARRCCYYRWAGGDSLTAEMHCRTGAALISTPVQNLPRGFLFNTLQQSQASGGCLGWVSVRED